MVNLLVPCRHGESERQEGGGGAHFTCYKTTLNFYFYFFVIVSHLFPTKKVSGLIPTLWPALFHSLHAFISKEVLASLQAVTFLSSICMQLSFRAN